ncbi:MAG TPA: hypothetical protein VFV68_16685 [Agriterribacter sp.]|nr:hypothetical protein [Agriterribacter sp.]
MTAYLRQILFNWNVCRIVRIIAGTPILIVGIRDADWPVIIFGAAFLATGLFSIYCCAAGQCPVPDPDERSQEKL